MFFHSKIDWQKIKHELDLLRASEGYSIGPLLLAINCYINAEPQSSRFFKKLYRYCFLIEDKVKNLAEEERLLQLNQFIFEDMQFQIIPESLNNNVYELLPESLLISQKGPALSIAIFYLHLAEFLELPIYLANHSSFCVLKWIRPKKTTFIDLSQQGKILTEEEVLEFFNNKKPIPQCHANLLERMSSKDIVTLYLEKILEFLGRTNFYKKIILIYDILLELHPSNTGYIVKRALTKKAIGLNKEALLDFKRYFTYIDKKDAPHEIKLAYYEANALSTQIDEMVH
ncbi:MAG: hypothetical protein KDD50_01205 [Bdellovibrionales bacterium]|nr:hypothetical protein [Bdellovibrionales bacterium]